MAVENIMPMEITLYQNRMPINLCASVPYIAIKPKQLSVTKKLAKNIPL
jgi:hypothetical protein